ncbi:MAG TPA: hypothetical protein VJR03_07765 [Nitrospira sp.]|nr:hypothetical protein [Nitrospira sp.]
MGDTESRSGWVLGLSLVQVMLLLFFATLLISVTQNVDVSGHETHEGPGSAKTQQTSLQADFDAVTGRNLELEKQLGDMTVFVDELKVLVGAKASSREGFQEAVENLKRGYALCQKDDNTLIEARIQNGAESVQVIGEPPSDLIAGLSKGEQTSDLEQIVSFIQDVYEYEKDHKCRFNYRLRYATDNDYRKARDGYEKYFYPEKILRLG